MRFYFFDVHNTFFSIQRRIQGGGGGREWRTRAPPFIAITCHFFFFFFVITLKNYKLCYSKLNFFFFFYLGFLLQPFTNHRTAGEAGEHFYNSSLPLPPASRTLRHQLGDYCRELTSAHRQQPDSNWEPLVSERSR